MTRKVVLYGRLIVTITTLAVLAAILFGGCAHKYPCQPPEERAAKFGTVLECNDDEERVRCLISTPSGDITRFFKVCK